MYSDSATDQPKHDITWLLWLDTLERLDTILLELRHHQVNLIHSLRCPSLYAILRYEEKYIWGSYLDADGKVGRWLDILAETQTQRDLADLTKCWIIPYPKHPHDKLPPAPSVGGKTSDADRHHNPTRHHEEDRAKAFNLARKGVEDSWTKGRWHSDRRRLHYALRALQTLKANILYDKLTLCRWGIRAIWQTERPRMLGRFLIVRAAVMKQANDHIRRLGDLRAQFEAALDLGIQDHPKPLIGRRREQGIYSTYLADRCSELAEMVEHFICSDSAPFKRREKHTHADTFMHRWNHSAISDAAFIKSSTEYGRDSNEYSVDIYNTSFFMPDRPDLQSVIAHEVSHAAILHGLGDLEPHALRHCEGDLPRLLRLISACLQDYHVTNSPGIDVRYELRILHRELACDIIAAIVKGPAYLFALTQEAIGQDLDILFSSPLRRIDFNLADHILDGGWATLEYPGFEWYLRLSVVCTVLEQLTPKDDVLAQRLITGVGQVSDSLLETIEELSPSLLCTEITLWRGMMRTVCQVIRDSELIESAGRWRSQRAKFADSESSTPTFANPTFPNSAKSLPKLIRNRLMGMLYELKNKPGRLMEGMSDHQSPEYCKEFRKRYLGSENAETRYLMEHLHDIPWQSGMLRARDFLCQENGLVHKSNRSPPDWLREMHLDGAPGRHLYQMALEFTYWLHRTSIDSILTIIDFLQNPEHLDETVKCSAKTREIINQWNKADPPQNSDDLRKVIDKFSRQDFDIDQTEFSRQAARALENVDPKLLLTPIENTLKGDVLRSGIAERMRGHFHILKIDQLRQGLKNDKAVLGPQLTTLLDYLDTICRDESVQQSLIQGMGNDTEAPAGTDTILPLVMLDRVVVSDETVNSLVWPHFWQPLPLRLAHEASPQDRPAPGRTYTTVLGRYDLIALTTDEPPMRSYLPQFNEEDSFKLPFFERHEMSIPFRLHAGPVPLPRFDPASEESGSGTQAQATKQGPFAFVCITLTSRAARLDFLYRLRCIVSKGNKPSHKNEESPSLSEVGGLVTSDDLVLLSEGWGDVVIAFGGKPEERLQDVFQIQSALYEDFQVDETELILSSACLAAATRGATTKDWKYSTVIRVKLSDHPPDSKLSETPQEHGSASTPIRSSRPNRDFTGNIKKYLHDFCPKGNGLTLTRTPGRTDFTVHVYCPRLLGRNSQTNSIALYDSFTRNGVGVDEVLTILSLRHELCTATNSARWTCDHWHKCPAPPP